MSGQLPSTTDDFLCDNLSPAELCRYSRVSKYTHEMVKSYTRRNFRLHDYLERYFTLAEVLQFRELQSRTGMLISGSVALQFLDRTLYPDSDLDLYIDIDHSKAVISWLTSIGYKSHPTAEAWHITRQMGSRRQLGDSAIFLANPRYNNFIPFSVSPLTLDFRKPNPNRKIKLTISYYAPLRAITHFHPTCVLNVITHEKAYAIYPIATFEERRSLQPTHYGTIEREKCTARGWKMLDQVEQEEIDNPKSEFSSGLRYLGDSKCWTLPILPELDLPESTVEANSWELHCGLDGRAKMTSHIVSAMTLRHCYFFVDGALFREIIKRFEWHLLIEHSEWDKELVDFVKTFRVLENEMKHDAGSDIIAPSEIGSGTRQ